MATSRSTVSALRVPMPVSMTSTAFFPTTMPTFGTSEAPPSGIAQTWDVSFSVTPSRTIEACGAGCWASAGAATSAANIRTDLSIVKASK